jgi:hypothetical protein
MPAHSPAAAPLARQAREQFVTHLEGVLAPLAEAIRNRLGELLDTAKSTKDMQDRRDAMLEFDRQRGAWGQAVQRAWRKAVVPPTATARVRLEALNLELIGDDVVENKILSSRLALAIQEKAAFALNDLRVRVQHLEGGEEMASEDILRPEAVTQILVEQWVAASLSRETWKLVNDTIQQQLVGCALEAYKKTNEFLVRNGVMPEIDLSSRVRRPAAGRRVATAGAGGTPASGPDTGTGATGPGALGPGGGTGWGGGGPGGFAANPPGGRPGSGSGGVPGAGAGHPGGGHVGGGGPGGAPSAFGGAAAGVAPGTGFGPAGAPAGGNYTSISIQGGMAGATAPGGATGVGGPTGMGGATGMGGPMTGHHPSRFGGGTAHGYVGGVGEETRMQTATTPLARARARATGVLGQLRRLLSDKVQGFDPAHVTRPSPALAEALAQHAPVLNTRQGAASIQGGQTQVEGVPVDILVYDDAAVQQVATDLRQRTGELKKKAAPSTEKATIEIVALMFQSILAEERIPPAVRVWFARLQMPVLRVAIAEPEFFGSLEHPARQLIDRMGSCVMGFDSSAINGSALETEIKRVVQVIEQYPETGRRVFQLVYDEFQKFLSRFLTESDQTQRLVSVAQQVEQKETMAIQYTIELRKMLADVPVRDEIREFLFKVWAEVLAVAAVKNGPQHEETIALKQSAADLVWAASAKPNRQERSKVINELPKLLERLRQGMTLLGVQGPAQEEHIKVIGDTLADAFLSKTEAIPAAQIEAMGKRLANLEDFVADDPSTDLPLDKETIELMLGIDASMIEVVADGGSKPNAAMLSWAMELQLGNWFTLDHNGNAHKVQYVWRSERKQLHLLASPDGRSFLIQARRLASYLQAGLLLPDEEEALTVRATRDALAKLDANPERLLQ